MKKIAIIGLPGSGKSTFALELGRKLELPVYHLDSHRFEKGRKKDFEEFLAIQKEILKKESWIIEGCATSTFEMRFAHADVVIYFQLSRMLCIARLLKRLFFLEKADTGCLRGINGTLLKYLWTFDRNKREKILALKEKYQAPKFYHVKSTKEVKHLLEELSRF